MDNGESALAQAEPKPFGQPFRKGMSGNPNGRPSTAILRKKLRRLEPLALKALKEDLEGPPGPERSKATALVLAYRHGKPLEQHQLQALDGQGLQVHININLGVPT